MSTEALKPPPDDEKPKPPPPPDNALASAPVTINLGPYHVIFDGSEPADPSNPAYTGAPQYRLVEVNYKGTALIRGMSGFLASHEVAPDSYRWMGGAHGYDVAGGWLVSASTAEVVAKAHSWLGPVGAPLAEREVKYSASYCNGVLGLRVATSTKALRPHRVRDVYDFMLPLSRAAFAGWRADTLDSEAIHRVVREPTSKLTESAITVRVRGNAADGVPNLWYQGHQGAPVYARMRPYDEQCKLYHRSRWQDPVVLEAGQELRADVSLFIGEHC